ncbi:MAG: transporter [Fusobacteriales bacterium]|jgi:MFS family permease|nr:transporter [Fusobacteriales bacterium]
MKKDFFYLLLGRVFLNIADSITMVFLPFFIYSKTKNNTYLVWFSALFVAMTILPGLIGPILDRVNKKRGLIITNIVQMISLVFIYFFMINDKNFNLYIVFVFAGIFMLFNISSYIFQQAVVPEVVEEKELEKANSFMQMAYGSVNIFADSVSGILITLMVGYFVFVLNIGFFAVSLIFFILIRQSRIETFEKTQESTKKIKEETKEKNKKSNYFKELKESYSILLTNKIVFSVFFVSILLQTGFQLVSTMIVAYYVDNNLSGLYPIFGMILFIGMFVGNVFSSNKLTNKLLPFYTLFVAFMWCLNSILFNNPYFVLVNIFLAGAFGGLMEPKAIYLLQNQVKEKMASTIGNLMSTVSIFKLLILLLVPVLYNKFSYNGLFFTFGIFLFLAFFGVKNMFVKMEEVKVEDSEIPELS